MFPALVQADPDLSIPAAVQMWIDSVFWMSGKNADLAPGILAM